MSNDLMSRDEAAEELVRLSQAATTAVRLPEDLADRVLSQARRRRRRTRAAWAVGAVLAVTGTAAAATLGNSDFYSVTQPSGAMEPTVEIGERVVFSKAATPRFGEVVHVQWADEGETYEGMSRIMGLAGDVVSCPREANGWCDAVLVDGAPVLDPYLSSLRTRPFAPTVVPEDAYFLMGDNRTNSNDSRQLGPVAVDTIEGVAVEIVSTTGDHRTVPGAPERDGPGEAELVDPPDGVPPAPYGPAED